MGLKLGGFKSVGFNQQSPKNYTSSFEFFIGAGECGKSTVLKQMQ